ncbi:hypothetical protein GQ600_12948 [Phytophthora cactorum]|nr:hypothetical protein GQ600_12948 [Phytophthora cactorum]
MCGRSCSATTMSTSLPIADVHGTVPGDDTWSAQAQLVPVARLRWRHFLLLRWHDLCRLRHPGSLQQDAAALLSAAGPQLPVLASSALQDRALPASPTAQVQREDGSTGAFDHYTRVYTIQLHDHQFVSCCVRPMKENHLVLALLAFQVLCCGLAFYIRYGISGYFYDFVQ